MRFFTLEFEILTYFDAVFVVTDSVQFFEQRRILLDRCRNACLQIPVRRIHMLPIVDIRIEIQVGVLQFESLQNSRVPGILSRNTQVSSEPASGLSSSVQLRKATFIFVLLFERKKAGLPKSGSPP